MSVISYNALRVDGLKEVLKDLSIVCKTLGIDFFIVGAVARNIWYASHGENAWGTKDIDVAIYVPSQARYNQLKEKLIKEYGYQASRENAFCLISSDGKQVDLLPFGEIENEDRVLIDGQGLTSISLVGFKESYQMGRSEVVIGLDTYMICSIPAIVVLKLIAFDDRPEHRVKDVRDIDSICKYYPQLESTLIFDEYYDLFDEDKEYQDIAMIVLGKEIDKIIKENAQLKKRIIVILDIAIDSKSAFLNHMIGDVYTETLEMKANILKNIKVGIMSQ